MSLVIVETTAEQPLTDKLLHDTFQWAIPCLAARNVTWRYSLLSSDRHRMVCTFDAPDAESVRESYRRAGLPSRPIWAGDLIELDAQPQCNLTHVMEGSYPALSETDWNEISRRFFDYCADYDIKWLQSYLSRDRTKVIYELNSPDLKPIQTAQHKLGIHCDRIWSAQVLSP